MNNWHIHWIDYTIIVISVIFAIGVGFYFARRQKSTDSYFKGSRSIPSWVLGISIFATLISSVTFLAYPGAAYASNWILLVQGLMVPIVLLALIGFIVPLFRKVIKLSTYEYFERRFGLFARIYSSLAFILTHFSKMGTVFFLVSMAMAPFLGLNIYTIILSLGIAIIVLTLFGGFEAVIWMDVVQGLMLIAGGLVCATVLLFKPEGGPAAMLQTAFEFDKISFGPYDWNLTHLTFIVMVLNGAFYAIQKYGTDQTIVQRYLAARNDKSAKKAAYIGVFLSLPIWTLFMFIGTGLFVYYHTGAATLPEGINAEEVFPYFIATELPVGVVGLILSALVAAAISTLDADMNCLAAIGVQDYYARFKPQSTDKQRLRMGRILVGISGVASVGIAMIYAYWGGEGILGIVFELYAIFSAGLVGLLLLGLFSRRANKQGLYVGIAASVIFTAYAMLTSTKFDFDDGLGKRVLLDLGSFNFPHHKYMLGVYSHIVLFVVGYFASYFFKTPLADKELTIFGYLEKKKEEKLKAKA